MRTVDPAKHRARRRQILGAAAELFAAKGFERTTTAEICKAAGMSSGNLFHYFPNKRAIFHAIFTEDRDDTTARLESYRADADPVAALIEVVDLLTAPALDPLTPPLVMEAMVQAYRDEELEEVLSRDNADERGTILHLLQRAAEAGRIDPGLDLESAASWIMALIGTLFTSAATEPGFDPAQQLPTLRLIITRYLRAE